MENDYVYFVYLTKNKINGKMYIGQHHCKREEVFTDGYLGSGVAIRLAIRKYGRENFERVILEYANSPEELNDLEAKYANEAVLEDDNFYNLKTGGKQNIIFSEETKEKIKEHHARPMLGKHFSKEHNQKISNALKGRIFSNEWKQKISQNHADMNGENNPFYQKHHSEETKKQLSLLHKGKPGLAGEKNGMFGKHHSEETKKKLSEANKNKIVSDETKKKISESGKGKQTWLKGRKCFNNGVRNFFAIECPDGCVLGKIFYKKDEEKEK